VVMDSGWIFEGQLWAGEHLSDKMDVCCVCVWRSDIM
jgi:hypothetical protein